MPALHLKQPRITDTTLEPFTKHRERIQKFRETGNLKHLYRNELRKVCFAHDTAHSDNKDLAKGAIADKILKDRACEIARNRGYDRYQRALGSMVYKFFDKKTGSGAVATSKVGMSVNEQLAEELHEPVIKFKRRKVYPIFKDNIWVADLAKMEPLSSKNKNIKYLYIYIYKYLCMCHRRFHYICMY